jgi:hypothetical protein
MSRKAHIPAAQWARWERANAAGMEAFRQGVPFDANPYPAHDTNSDKSQWAFWRGGWRKAEGQSERPAAEARRAAAARLRGR